MITPITKVMTKNLVTVPMGTSVFQASNIMAERGIRHLPVVDELDDVVGIISQRDLNGIADFRDLTVDFMMKAPVKSVSESSSLRQSVTKMLENKISCVLVVDKNQDVKGIVTTDDLLRHLAYLLDEMEPVLLPYGMLPTMGELAQKVADMGI